MFNTSKKDIPDSIPKQVISSPVYITQAALYSSPQSPVKSGSGSGVIVPGQSGQSLQLLFGYIFVIYMC